MEKGHQVIVDGEFNEEYEERKGMNDTFKGLGLIFVFNTKMGEV